MVHIICLNKKKWKKLVLFQVYLILTIKIKLYLKFKPNHSDVCIWDVLKALLFAPLN